MAKRAWMQAEQLEQIRQWFARHQHDYCAHDNAPPVVWQQHFRYLLDLASADRSRLRGEATVRVEE